MSRSSLQTVPLINPLPLDATKVPVTAELLGTPALNSFILHDSSARVQMFCSHTNQALEIRGRKAPRFYSGIDREIAKYTFGVTMPADGTITKVVPYYVTNVGGIKESPFKTVFYEDADTLEIGCFTVPKYHLIHHQFGFNYRENPKVRLAPGQAIKKGTIIADSPKVDKDGSWCPGIDLATAFMSLDTVIEDSIEISEYAQEQLTTYGYGVRSISITENMLLRNLHGDENTFKGFPDIGDTLGDDGLIASRFKYDPLMAALDLSEEFLSKTDEIYDDPVTGEPNARVIDVRVIKDTSGKLSLPMGMEEQLEKYVRATELYDQAIVAEHDKYKRRHRGSGDMPITRNYQRVVGQSMANSGYYRNERVEKTFRRIPIEQYRIEIVFQYDIVPGIGNKMTGLDGDKGVIGNVRATEDMPVDDHGNICHVLCDGRGTANRMNEGREFRHYFAAAARDLEQEIRIAAGYKRHGEDLPHTMEDISLSPEFVDRAYEDIFTYWKIVSPKHAGAATEFIGDDNEEKLKKVRQAIFDMFRTWYPIEGAAPSHYDTPGMRAYSNIDRIAEDAVMEMEEWKPPLHAPVTFPDGEGGVIRTHDPVMIADLHWMLLEKTGESWAACSSAKMNTFGIPSKLTEKDRFSTAGKQQPIRNYSETEGRYDVATIGPKCTANVIDQSTNPEAHRALIRSIYKAKNPTDIDIAVDRKAIPTGNGRPAMLYRHNMACGGWKFVRKTPEERMNDTSS